MVIIKLLGMALFFIAGFFALAVGTFESGIRLGRAVEDMITVYYIIGVILGLIPAFIAKNKGRSFYLWWIYGWAIFLVAFIHSLFLKPTESHLLTEGMIKCPFCAELIKSEAKICRYCGKEQQKESLEV